MKHIVALLLALAGADLACAQTSVGVSVSVAQPGVYGRIDIGNVPPPVVYAQPVVIAPSPVAHQPPLYLYVPPGHQKHWAQHCAQYNACGQPVYFVRESWVQQRYAEEHGHGKGANKDKKNKGKHADD
ncbi:MAG TPA: hypothetical protein VE029_05230 [Rhizobacter sp.]|nr:hypothetical protein [Rhizobacter sp.]